MASEPLSICGVDVAAPQQLRVRGSQQKMTIPQLRSIFDKQFTPYEVCAFRSPSPPSGRVSLLQSFHADAHAIPPLPIMLREKPCATVARNVHGFERDRCCFMQWASIDNAGTGNEAKEAMFRRLWSLKEVIFTSSLMHLFAYLEPPTSLFVPRRPVAEPCPSKQQVQPPGVAWALLL